MDRKSADAAVDPAARRRLKWLAVGLAPIASLGVLEIGFRWRAHVGNRDSLGSVLSVPPAVSARGEVRFCDIIRPSTNDRIIFELRPDLDVVFKGGALTTNSLGLRGPERPAEPDRGAITIVGLGGSHMFGHGVADEDVYLARLEELLGQRHPERRWRAVNTAVPSHNAATTIEVLKTTGLAYAPDLVVLHLDMNALDMPTYVRTEKDPLELGRSFLLDFFREVGGRRAATQEHFGELAFVERDALPWHAALKSDPEQVPRQYRGLVGWRAYYAALDELARLARQGGFDVIAFAYLDIDINPRLLEVAAEFGLHAVSFSEEISEHLERRTGSGEVTLERYLDSDLVVGPGNPHPSPLLHRMTAEWLARELEASGALARALAAH